MHDDERAPTSEQVGKLLDGLRRALAEVHSAAARQRSAAWALQAQRQRLADARHATLAMAGEAARAICREVRRVGGSARSLVAGVVNGLDKAAAARCDQAAALAQAAATLSEGVRGEGDARIEAIRAIRGALDRHGESVAVAYERALAVLSACGDKLRAADRSAGAIAEAAQRAGAAGECLATLANKRAREAGRSRAMELNETACSHLQCGQTGAAVRLLEQACEADDAPGLRFNLAVAQFCAGNLTASRRLLNRCTGAPPDLVRALHALIELSQTSAVLLAGGAAAGAVRRVSAALRHGAAPGELPAAVVSRATED